MSKFVMSLVLAGALLVPALASADCGCAAPAACCQPCNPCCNPCDCAPRTRLKLARVQKEVTRCQRVCVVDACGCARVERVPVTECVTRLQLVRVPRQPRGCR